LRSYTTANDIALIHRMGFDHVGLSEVTTGSAAQILNFVKSPLYWRVGDRIRRSILGSERAGYGERILATLSQELVGDSAAAST
jgi:hypothetical protein